MADALQGATEVATWWSTSKPVFEAIGILLGIVLGCLNLGWLIIQGRRARDTQVLALQAHRWAMQKRGERRSELAEQALLAIRAACLHLHHWCLILAMETTQERGDDAAVREGVRSAVAFGRGATDSLKGSIQSMRWRTSIHLKPDEQQLLMNAEGLLVQAALEADEWAKKHDSVERDRARDVFMELSRQADTLRVSADTTLGPVVLFDDPDTARSSKAGP